MPSSHQPRFLVQYADNQKKRFMSPNQIRLHPTNSQQQLNFQFNHVQKVYSPQSKFTYQTQQNQKGAAKQSVQQILQQNKKMQTKSKLKPANDQPLKQKPAKDYMMTNLAKLNYKKKEEQHTSRSRSKNKIQNDKSKKRSEHNQEYGGNSLYSNKQKQIQRRNKNESSVSSNNQSQSQISGKPSQSYLKNTSNQFLGYEKFPEPKINTQQIITNLSSRKANDHMKNQKQLTKIIQFQNKNNRYLQKDIEKQKHQQPEENQNKHTQRQRYQETQSQRYQKNMRQKQAQSKAIVNSAVRNSTQQNQIYQNNYYYKDSAKHNNEQFYRQSNFKIVQKPEVNNSQSLIQHLQKAHEQKQQIRVKFFESDKQKKQLNQQVQGKRKSIMDLKGQVQQLKSKNQVLEGQLKKYIDLQKNAQQSLNFSNTKNQQVYRQIHSKYQNLQQSNRDLHSQIVRLNHELHTYQQKGTSLQAKIKYLQNLKNRQQAQFQKKQQINQKEVKSIDQQYKQKLKKIQNQQSLYKKSQPAVNNASSTIRIIELETTVLHRQKTIKEKQQQIKQLRQHMTNKINNLESLLSKKQGQIIQQQKDYESLKKKVLNDMQVYQQKIKKAEFQLIEKDRYVSELKMKIQMNQTNLKDRNYNINISPQTDVRQSNQTSKAISNIVTSQTEDINKLKQDLFKKVQHIFKLQTEMQECKIQIKNMEQELNINKMMLASVQRKSKQTATVQLSNLKSQIQSNSSKIKSLQQKLEMKVNQIKQKDQFIQNYLLRMTSQQNIPDVLSQLNKILHSF